MQDISKFFIYTRGRTGSTAVIDEINKHPDITCWQELFIALSSDAMMESFYQRHGVRFSDYEIKMHWRPTFELWSRQFRKVHMLNSVFYLENRMPRTSAGMVRRYLEETSQIELEMRKKAVGFKLLQNQADVARGFFRILKESGYKAIYLERVNVVKRVISGIIANRRKTYNAKNYQSSDDVYTIDMAEFKSLVDIEINAVNMEKRMLEKNGFEILYVTYEEFLEDRKGFYTQIFDFIGVDNVLPDETEFSIMIPSVSDVVENYEELKECVKAMGYERMLA